MARPKKAEDSKRNIDAYTHDDKDRVNNPPAGLVTCMFPLCGGVDCI